MERSGPDHQPRFLIEAVLSDGRRARGEGSAKRSAEQAAAAALMTQVANDD
ncbi:MAG: double-stranded RNA binding motif domain-containing protein [Pseudomonadota bacterium]